MDDVDPKELTDEQWQDDFDALVAHDAEWRNYFASQSASEQKAQIELPKFEFSHAE